MNQLLQGAQSLARSLKVVNEALTSLDLGFNEIRVRMLFFLVPKEIILSLMLSDSQDDGAFAIAQALKSNDDVAVTSLNIASNFLTKFGQVMYIVVLLLFLLSSTVHFILFSCV